MSLAAAGEEMLPPADEPHFRKLQGVMKVDDMSVGLGTASQSIRIVARISFAKPIRSTNLKYLLCDLPRAMAKFDAVFERLK